MIGFGIFTTSVTTPMLSGFIPGEYSFTGRVLDYTPVDRGDKTLMELYSLRRIDNPKQIVCDNTKLLVTISDVSKIQVGNIVSGKGKFDFVDARDNVRNDDYIAYLKSKGVLLKGISNESAIEIHGRETLGLRAFFHNIREFLEIKIEKSSLSTHTKAFIMSVALGDRSYMQQLEKETFIDGGVAHIFAVSGMHVAIVSGIIITLLSLIFYDGRRKWIYLAVLPFVWFYVLLTGASPATLRAGIMITIAMIALFLQRKNDPLVALGWSLLLILALFPYSLFDVGLQLSAVCVGSLILFAQQFNFIDHRRHPRLYYLVSIILVSLIASFSSWVISAFYFHKISLMFLPANILAVPLLPVYIIVSIVYLCFCIVGIDINMLAWLLNISYSGFLDYVSFFNDLSYSIKEINIGLMTVVLWLIGIVSLGYMLKRRVKYQLLIPAFFFIGTIISLFAFPIHGGPDGLIIQKRSDALAVVSYDNGKEFQHEFKQSAISSQNIMGKQLLVIDRLPLSFDSLHLNKTDIIILGAHIGRDITDFYEELIQLVNAGTKLVVHPSVHWKYDRKMREKSYPNHHSLRYDGPLHIFED